MSSNNEAMKRALSELKKQMLKQIYKNSGFSDEETSKVEITLEEDKPKSEGSFGDAYDKAFEGRMDEVEERRREKEESEEPESTFDAAVRESFEADRRRKEQVEKNRMRPDIVARSSSLKAPEKSIKKKR